MTCAEPPLIDVLAPSKLVDWMIKFQFDGDVDYFEVDPVAYGPALGDVGMKAYRARLEAGRATLGPGPPGADRSVPDRHDRWLLQRNDRPPRALALRRHQLGVLDHFGGGDRLGVAPMVAPQRDTEADHGDTSPDRKRAAERVGQGGQGEHCDGGVGQQR